MTSSLEVEQRPARGRQRQRTMAALLLLVLVAAAVLRVWRIAGMRLIWDEAFTGATARLPFDALISFLRGHDVHPPLDYLLRSPIAGHTTSAALLRLPSAVASFAAVGLTGWWLRRRPLLAVGTAALMAVGSFQLTYAWQARPYAPMVLVGVGLAFLSHRWLRDGDPRLAVVCGLVLLVGCFESETCLLLAAGLFVLPGLRRDRGAWLWRASVAGAAVLWLGAWSFVLVDQLPNVSGQAPVPLTTVSTFLATVNELVDLAPALIPLVVLLLVAGGLCLGRDDRPLARVWCCGFVVPLVVAAILGLRMHVLWPHTLAFASWGPMLALAAVVDAGVRRWRPLGLAAAAILAVVVLPSTAHTLNAEAGAAPVPTAQLRVLERVVGPGDTVLGSWRLERAVDWYFGRAPAPDSVPSHAPVERYAFVPRPGPATGRIWVVDSVADPLPVAAASSCAPRRVFRDGGQIRCLERAR